MKHTEVNGMSIYSTETTSGGIDVNERKLCVYYYRDHGIGRYQRRQECAYDSLTGVTQQVQLWKNIL